MAILLTKNLSLIVFKMKKKFVENFYNLPHEVKFCKVCTVSNQRPRITFDKYIFVLRAILQKKKNLIGRKEESN